MTTSRKKILVIGDVSYECGIATEPPDTKDSDNLTTHRLGLPIEQDGHLVVKRGGAWRIADYIDVSSPSGSTSTAEPRSVPIPAPGKQHPSLFSSETPPLQFVDLNRFAVEMTWSRDAKRWLPRDQAKTYRISGTVATQHSRREFFEHMAAQLRLFQRFDECSTLVICDRQLGFRESAFEQISGSEKLSGSFAATLLNFLNDFRKSQGESRKPCVVLETTNPLDDHEHSTIQLLREAGLFSRCIVVMSVNSLKSSGIEIRDDLSLERAVEDFHRALSDAVPERDVDSRGFAPDGHLLRFLYGNRPKQPAGSHAGPETKSDNATSGSDNANALSPTDATDSSPAYVIVRLGIRAALIWNPTEWDAWRKHPCTSPSDGSKAADKTSDSDSGKSNLQTGLQLVFGPDAYEASLSAAVESSDLGSMYGYSSFLAGELAKQIAGQNEDAVSPSDIHNACIRGMLFAKEHFRKGLGDEPRSFLDPEAHKEHLKRQYAEYQKSLSVSGGKFYEEFECMEVGDLNPSHVGDWTILQKLISKHRNLPVEVVQKGRDMLKQCHVPFVQHVDLYTADRHEIENYAGITSLIIKYIDDEDWDRPLCLAVFGPPGCGKNFGITQVANAINGYKPQTHIETMTFNLSQFRDASRLVKAFHRIRNVGLSGKLPLVFLDEFDSSLDDQEFGWLKYLLAPMQDGQFIDGEETLHLPRTILVFVGGQNRDYHEFEGRLRDEKFIAAKGRDFMSRLRHFLAVKGPDLPGPGDLRDTKPSDSASGAKRSLDHSKMHGRRLRRAIQLRSVIERKLKVVVENVTESGKRVERAHIDPAIINAFLNVEEYKHGARSLEAIVEMSSPSGTRRSFQKSSLPPKEQLELHVNADDFLKIVNESSNANA